jgi:DNA-binding transcriptional ArsR family regulator
MARPRTPVRDFTAAAAAVRIEWDVRPTYDFFFSLSGDAGSTDDLPPADRQWLTEARASFSAEVAASVSRLFENELCINVAGFLVDRPDLRSSDELVAALEEAGQQDVLRPIFIGALHGADRADLVDRYLAGERQVLPELLERIGDWKREEWVEVLGAPERTYHEVLAVTRAWAQHYGTIEDRVRAIIERDHEGRAEAREKLAGSDLVEATTGGIRWLPEARVRRVILAPSYFSRPYNFVLEGEGWRFFGYPVSDDAVERDDPLAPPQSVVRLHRALGDETRMRILRLLADKDLYLTEIAHQLELSKPTIKHHLALLRAAGLVTVTESGAMTYYTLRKARLDDASADLKRFLQA